MSEIKEVEVKVRGESEPPARWLHVDINAYFATMLQQENPSLRGRPIGILKSAGRSCVITSSKEAKALGVKTGCSAIEAKQLAPGILFLPAEFALYLDATHKLHHLFRSFVPDYEIFSLDEAFLDLTHCQRLYPSARSSAERIQQEIKNALGEWVTCNVGISHNRFLAKMASETAPKNSIAEITADNLEHYLQTTLFRDVCGIGHALEKKLHRFNITSLAHIRETPQEMLQILVGPYWVKELKKMSRGEEPNLFVHHAREQLPKSVGRSITGYKPTNDSKEIFAVLHNLIDEVTHKARDMKLAGRYAGVYLRGSHGEWWGSHIRTSIPLRHAEEFFAFASEHLEKKWLERFPVIRFAVVLSDLQPWNATPEPWLPNWQRREKLESAMHTVNEKFGLFTVRSSLLTNRDIIRPEVTGFLGDRAYQFSKN